MSSTSNTFDHVGLLYDSPASYVTGTVTFVREALEDGGAVLVAVPPPGLQLIRDGLKADAERVLFIDMTIAGRNPGRILPGLLMRFADHHEGRRVSIIGEPIWPGRSALEYPVCAAHETLINVAFKGRDAAVLCPYDAAGLDAAAVADSWRTHPVIERDGIRCGSEAFTDPLLTAATFNQPLPQRPSHASVMAFQGAARLRPVRRFVDRFARGAGLPEPRIADLVIAVNEIVSNSVEHADGDGEISLWIEQGMLVCQVSDTGEITDPMAGRVPPEAFATRGRGLVVVNLLCDLVRIHTRPGQTTTRIHVAI